MEPTTSEVATAAVAHQQPGIFTPDLTMVILTWVTFVLLLVILKKFAWKPILDNLQQRENYIQQSLKDADTIKQELAEVEKRKQGILEEAKTQAAQIIHQSRETARAVAVDIETKAKEHAQSIRDTAQAQIEGEYQQKSRQLQKESAAAAVELASKILKENMDTDKNRRLIESALKEI